MRVRAREMTNYIAFGLLRHLRGPLQRPCFTIPTEGKSSSRGHSQTSTAAGVSRSSRGGIASASGACVGHEAADARLLGAGTATGATVPAVADAAKVALPSCRPEGSEAAEDVMVATAPNRSVAHAD